MTCAAENAASVDQSHFWDGENLNWEAHRIGWAIAGGCAVLTLVITTLSVGQHCRSYTNPAEQRQILRILYMPAIYAIISFFSYRFFRSYTYYSLVEIAYEAITLSAFLLLIIEYVAATASGHDAHAAIERKDKSPLPIPFCCWRYRPTKAYFMYTVKWSVLQYVIIRPACSVAGIICEKMGVLCEAEGFDPRYARANLDLVSVDDTAFREIETETLILQGDTIIVGEEPLLSREIVEALPNLHAYAVRGGGTCVKAKVRPFQLDLRRSGGNDPVLSGGQVAVEDIDSGSVRTNVAAQIETFVRVDCGVDAPRNLSWSREG